jgi:hypothetical protein
MGADGWPNEGFIGSDVVLLNYTLVYSTKTNAAILGDWPYGETADYLAPVAHGRGFSFALAMRDFL